MRRTLGALLVLGLFACGRDGIPSDLDEVHLGDAGEGEVNSDAEAEDRPAPDRPDRPMDRPDRPTDRPDRPIPDACDLSGGDCSGEDLGPRDGDPGDVDPEDDGGWPGECDEAGLCGTPDADASDVGEDDGGEMDAGDADPADDLGPILDSGTSPECAVDGDCNFGERCSPTLLACVACWNDQHCLAGRVCDETGGYVCRNPCLAGVCLNGVCDPVENACVGCLSDQDCGGGEVCDPNTRECVACTDDADCALEPGRPVCDTTSNTCVACRGDGDCGAGQICDESVNACVSPSGRELCEPCTSDGECGGPNDWCLALGGVFDRACGRDCRNTPCPSGYACVPARNNSGMQCRPDYATGLSGWTSTCLAVRNLGQACEHSSSTLDPGCGYENVRDARCVAQANGNAICSYACTRPEDCPTGTTCSGNASNPGACL